MPIYDFRCETCGDFEEWRSMSESSNPMVCPSCDRFAKRIYSTAGLIQTPRSLSRRIEQSAEPKLVQRSQEPKPQKHHNNNCGRPWMVGH
ncbi:zinc ribbon domain-containing protein [Microcoleus sp. FACHB-831]|uniref:FmdB family zinc ribbon protein n=1 Tax=Microcoleus sp. FACHB-831 TaxID=2692827 RepID=UPI001687882D|nr:zinc ribbon domain-containing protein [Microcoleus sp. FACHB-831]MBD1920817.1 zinc ribbon domain-containing protein [Microcoleus sp. FACHB-831]